MRFLASFALIALLLGGGALGCGGEERDGDTSSGERTRTSTDDAPHGQDADLTQPRLQPLPCPAAAGNCASASGTILYVERVDPDGDGDAHFVLISSDGVTAPGITVVDVRRGLRPPRLPGPGDALSAQGPVFTGSYGQRQIQANAIRVGRTQTALGDNGRSASR